MNNFLLNDKKKIIIGLVVLLIISSASSYFYFQKIKRDHEAQAQLKMSQDGDKVNLPTRNSENEELKTLNILLLGYGGAGHQGGFLTDVIQVLHFNFEINQVALISIPRDLWVKLPNGQSAKINQALTLGDDSQELVKSGGIVAKEMAAIITGLPIDYFVAVDFVGFKRLIGEELGGITVEIPQTLEDPWYPITGEELNPCGKSPEEIAQLTASYSGFELEKQFECRYEQLYFPQGEMTMEGGEALKYVRSRHGSSAGDFDRSQRQQVLLDGIKNKLLSLEVFQKTPEIFDSLKNHVVTDLDLKLVEYLAPAIEDLSSYEARNLILSTENVLVSDQTSNGQFVLRAKAGFGQWQEIRNYLQQNLYDI